MVVHIHSDSDRTTVQVLHCITIITKSISINFWSRDNNSMTPWPLPKALLLSVRTVNDKQLRAGGAGRF